MTDKEVMSLLSAITKANKKHEKRQMSILRRGNKNGEDASFSDVQKGEKPNGQQRLKNSDARSGVKTRRPLINIPNPTKAQSGAG